MNFKMFIEFPGILITIGVLFLIASIILGIIAYKKSDVIAEEEKPAESKPSEFFNSIESVNNPSENIEEIPTVEDKVETEMPIPELEETQKLPELVIEDTEETVIDNIPLSNEENYEYNFDSFNNSVNKIDEKEEEIELL